MASAVGAAFASAVRVVVVAALMALMVEGVGWDAGGAVEFFAAVVCGPAVGAPMGVVSGTPEAGAVIALMTVSGDISERTKTSVGDPSDK